MIGLVDLHVHTQESDGSMSPTEVVEKAAMLGLSAIAITDHDTADGVEEALAAGEAKGIEVVPGIELSVDYKGYGIHILAYCFEPGNKALGELLDWVVWERERRNEEIAAAMADDGLGVTMEYMHSLFPEAIIGRPHFSTVLVEKGLVKDVAEGFKKYLSPGGRYYRKRRYIPMDMAFDTLHRCGAKAVFAHPLQYKFSHEELLELTALLKEKGIVGMECIYSVYSGEEIEYLKNIAKVFDLCITGGSDFHGAGKPNIQIGAGCGDMEVSYELLEKLKKV